MDERMTLEMVRDRLRLYADYLSTGGYEGKVLSPADVEACADSITQHLTQPAQAVDLGALSWLPAELRILAFGDELEDMTTGEAYHAGWNECLDAIRRHRTRAIGNAQAEGWTLAGTLNVQRWKGIDSMINTDFDYASDLPDGTYQLFTPTPPTQATPNAHE